jgi:hypothetical protein
MKPSACVPRAKKSLGPFKGRLNNAGDNLELRQPGAPDPNTQVAPRILRERVRYSMTQPWPATASGTGATLPRRDTAAFGNDPVNWIAARPTPGRGLAPPLTLQIRASDLLLSGEDSPLTWELEEAVELERPMDGRPSTAAPGFRDGYWQAVVPRSPDAMTFFRLQSP